ncbi:MAG: FAD/FMN-containing dehydrogenase/Fe-S oxidoreductase [Phycisphaerales bacterium]|jgi:FAD/FMN-containing dehydrogenase/Fe-S oxidoreductase
MPISPTESRAPRLRALANAVRGEVRLGLHDRLLYSTDASIYQVEPLAVVVPESLEDAAAAVTACHAQGLPLLPRGGGTSLAGQCVNEAVVLDLSSRCASLIELNAPSNTCSAEAGMTVADLNAAIAHTGLFFPPDPSTVRQATVGGCIGNNAAGAHSVLYGRTSENVLGVEVCLADGQRVTFDEGAATRDPRIRDITERVVRVVRQNESLIRDRFPKTLRRSAGYQLDVILAQLDAGGGDLARVNLAPLMCGAEGTLAITLSASLRLRPLPRATGLGVIAFADLDEAIAAVVPLLATNPSAIELLDDLIIDLAKNNAEQRRHVELLPEPESGPVRAVLYVEYFADSRTELDERLNSLRDRFPGTNLRVHTEPGPMSSAWALRVAGEPLLHGIAGHRKPIGFVEDNAVPPERLSEFVRGFREIVTSEGTTASYYAHASVGVLHVRPLLNLKDSQDRERMQRIAPRVAALAKSLGGVMSGEHGDGRARGPLLEPFFGPELMQAFSEIKAIFDPDNRLNPGNIVAPKPIESITQHLRVRPGAEPVRVPPIQTFFDYGDQTDFAHAVEMCNGAGVCRKRTGGVMCPSYQATLDERHSTRGRGNALRLAITGQSVTGPPSARWNDPETIATLDLCLSCKACKAECPSNVDVSRLKAEYHAQRHAAGHRPPLSARAMGSIARLQSLASLTPRLATWLSKQRLARTLMHRALGIDKRRSLPPIKRSLTKQWGPEAPAPPGTPRVLLLADTFTNHNEPEIGLATKKVFEAFGYAVDLLAVDDLTRAKISLGLLPEAIRAADATLTKLKPRLDNPDLVGVIVCEPSCLSAITDDWLELKLSTPIQTRRRLSSLAMLPEQFLENRWDQHPGTPEFTAPDGEIVLHAHCHQKALWGADSSAALLERLFTRERVTTLDTTCCGLAGSFGYSADRYDLSMQIGELGVLPAARSIGPTDLLVATGTSCRHQIKDGAHKQAIHPIELVASSLRRPTDR